VAYVRRTSVQFCETLRGTFVAGLRRAPSTPVAEPSEPLSLRLTVTIDDIDEFLESPEHRARADGWIDTPAVGGRRPVSSAWVHLLVPASPGASRIRYLVHFADHHAAPRTLWGVKNLTTGPPTLAWSHTTTLPYRLLSGDRDEEDEAVGAGVLRLRPIDLLRQIASFRTTGAGGVAALHRFGGLFLGHIWSMYHPH
jgi:cholesterol oxidase